MGDVVNLREFRKGKARQEKSEKAAANRRKHGRTKAEVERDNRRRDEVKRSLDDKQIDDDS
ncbi:MAG: DUF4169 family protein [Alphaproteobacteria bacterium]|jgi:hypothetical protein|nr:DUF4169 family protein [Alphaproteobacteria bacterium]